MKSLLLIVACLAAPLFPACGDDNAAPSATSSPAPSTPTRSATPLPSATPAAASTSPPPASCAANPDPGTPDEVQVDTPLAGDSVSSPVTVRGRIAAFEAAFRIRVFDADGHQLADVAGMSSEGQTLSPFSQSVAFSVSRTTPGCIWVFEPSARDGSPSHVFQIPVTLRP